MSVMKIIIFSFFTILMIICQKSYAEYSASTTSPVSSPSSSCGDIDLPRVYHYEGTSYKLYCENSRMVIYLTDFLYFNDLIYKIRRSYRYYVEAINYNNHTIRLVAPNVKQNNCSFLPLFPLAKDFFTRKGDMIQTEVQYLSANGTISRPRQLTQPVIFLRCNERVNSSRYIDASPCINGSASSYSYVVVGSDFTFSDLKDSCGIEVVTLISARNKNFSSYAQVHAELAYGFELALRNRKRTVDEPHHQTRNDTPEHDSCGKKFK